MEIGLDILNPVQVSAANRDTAELECGFGRGLVARTCGVDTQQVLGSGTPAEVRAEVLRRAVPSEANGA